MPENDGLTPAMTDFMSQGPWSDVFKRLADIEKAIRELESSTASGGGGDDFLVVQVFS